MMSQEPEGIKVEIYDQIYVMKGALDEEYVKALARMVDAKMRSIATRTRTVDTLRVAVLAAMNIADECQQLRSKMAQVEQRVAECSTVLDDLLRVS
jgi:cell division protein ZapA